MIHDHLTWTGLAYGVVFVLMAIGLLLMWAWPRTDEGKLMSVDEVQEFMDKFPKTPTTGRMKMHVLMIMIFIASLGLALVGKNNHHSDFHHD